MVMLNAADDVQWIRISSILNPLTAKEWVKTCYALLPRSECPCRVLDSHGLCQLNGLILWMLSAKIQYSHKEVMTYVVPR